MDSYYKYFWNTRGFVLLHSHFVLLEGVVTLHHVVSSIHQDLAPYMKPIYYTQLLTIEINEYSLPRCFKGIFSRVLAQWKRACLTSMRLVVWFLQSLSTEINKYLHIKWLKRTKLVTKKWEISDQQIVEKWPNKWPKFAYKRPNVNFGG